MISLDVVIITIGARSLLVILGSPAPVTRAENCFPSSHL